MSQDVREKNFNAQKPPGGCEDGAVGGDEGGGEIEWKQKNKSQYGTCDKNILTPLSIKICPLFDEAKKGIFF